MGERILRKRGRSLQRGNKLFSPFLSLLSMGWRVGKAATECCSAFYGLGIRATSAEKDANGTSHITCMHPGPEGMHRDKDTLKYPQYVAEGAAEAHSLKTQRTRLSRHRRSAKGT